MLGVTQTFPKDKPTPSYYLFVDKPGKTSMLLLTNWHTSEKLASFHTIICVIAKAK